MAQPKLKTTKEFQDDFRNKLAKEANRSQNELIAALILEAKKGDSSALKAILDRVFEEAEPEENEKTLPVNDEQFNQIILIRARRIRGDLQPRSA